MKVSKAVALVKKYAKETRVPTGKYVRPRTGGDPRPVSKRDYSNEEVDLAILSMRVDLHDLRFSGKDGPLDKPYCPRIRSTHTLVQLPNPVPGLRLRSEWVRQGGERIKNAEGDLLYFEVGVRTPKAPPPNSKKTQKAPVLFLFPKWEMK